MSEDLERISRDCMLMCVQHWGQTKEQRDAATKAYVEAAGFEHGTNDATAWLRDVVLNLRRGEFNDECRQLQRALEARRSTAAA
jgi:hypothetical protein